ncbi:hypothetical protein N7492_002452 [Penicillium capsulatum]|uniref:U6 snRNA phosphodiesterase 1 n=1 Tax=Penicillium capsulatum TaxID=69766 RepID=A0A9W9LWG1_9EURO|nr:hypothetical protein N7492_002452 [Penicillium capsulatum]KAJ6122943.1 hypothetical protein N7512_005408 [Penicillium capsulatum]
MALVQYSDSDSDSEAIVTPPAKRPRQENTRPPVLPPLPPSFHNLYASSSRVSVTDDPSLHGGRKRVIPHVEGNWPTHLYLEWYPSKQELSCLAPLIAQSRCQNEAKEGASVVESLLYSDLGAQLPLHISLSRPVVLRTEQRSAFTDSLQRALQVSHIKSFEVTPAALKWQDLQTFQAEHFPGRPPSLIVPAPEPEFEEDDLGYYPDGVKRTLTDEQIRIFRHSEIHALLRERQLREDDVEYEARRLVSEDAQPTLEVQMPNKSAVLESQKNEHVPAKRKAQEDPYKVKTHRVFERETHDPGLQALDYEESPSVSAAPSKPADNYPQQPRRRIISYED